MVSNTDQEAALKVELLEQSFEKVKPRANDFAASFYENLFTDYPAAQPLFAHTNMAEQSNKLLASLVYVVQNLRKPGELTDALEGLGARHVKYGALPAHYPLVGSSLLKTFEQYLGGDWTPETEQAWVEAYGVITEIMLEGADYSKEEVELEPSPAAPLAAPLAAPVDEATGLKVTLLEQSFEKVKPHANDFITSFYNNLFTDYPAAQPLFAHTNMKEQGNKLLMSLVFVIENLRKPGDLTGALKGLGARHVKYGALPEHYPLVGNSLLKTFDQYLKGDWTPEVKQAWVEAYGLITEVMLEGADYAPESVQLTPAAGAAAGAAVGNQPVSADSPAPAPEEGLKAGPLLGGLIGGGAVLLIILLLL